MLYLSCVVFDYRFQFEPTLLYSTLLYATLYYITSFYSLYRN